MDVNNDLLAAINSVEPTVVSNPVENVPIVNSLSTALTTDLGAIFTDEALTKLTLADFSKPLNEILIKLSQPSTQEAETPSIPTIPWEIVENDDLLTVKLSYQFPNNKLNAVLDKLVAFEEFSLSFEVSHVDKEHLSVTVKGEMSKDIFEANKDSLGAKLYSEILSDIESTQEILDDVSFNEAIELAYDESAVLPISAFMQETKHLIKVPIAKKGSFHHPEYKVLDFSEEVLENIEQNINEDVLGYPIPITFGHSGDGAFKEGELFKVYREDDVLFGEWEVKPSTYQAVKAGDINFSSAEFFPNYMDKKTGKTIGRTLFGMALTNKPYIPNQPKVLALSDAETAQTAQSCYFLSQLNSEELQYNNREVLTNKCSESEATIKYSTEDIEMTENKDQEVINTDQIKLSNDLQLLKEQLSEYHTKLTSVETAYQEKLSVQESLNQQLQDRIQKYEDRIKEEEVNAKLTYLKELHLPTAITEKYSDLVKTGALGDSEEVVLSSLAELSQVNNSQLLTQHGVSNSTANMNDETYADPYAKVIEYNKKIVEAKRVNTLAALQS